MKTKSSIYLLLIIFLTFISSYFFWLIFYFNIPGKIGFSDVTLETIYANYDGPNYMVIGKCGYNKDCIGPNFSLPQPLEYYPAHFPGYPFLIKFFNNFTTGPKAMIFSTLIGSVFLSLILFELLKLLVRQSKAFWLTILFLFFPARIFILRSIGAPETWFLATTLASILFFIKGKYWLSALFAAVAQFFKSPGILLLASYGIMATRDYMVTKKLNFVFKKYYSYILVPLTILFVFYLYYLQTGNFFAYFDSGDNFHLNPLPYLVFISSKSWINTIWLEDIIYIYLFAMYGIYRLIKKYKVNIIVVYPLLYIIATLFVAHRDISRYITPAYPFLLLAYQKFFNLRSVKIILILLIPAILLYSINFVCGNIAPISDWANYL